MSFWKIDKPGSEPSTPAQPTRAEPTPAPPAAERAAAPPPPPATAREEAAPSARGNHLHLGRAVRLEGKLTFSGTVRIDATFQGSIVTDGVLVVGSEAKVDADIACGTVIVEGAVNGNVVAREAVEIHATGALRGDVETPSLAIERGAVFNGASSRPARATSAAAGKAAAAPAATAP